jgi:NAD(P)-dependent dehydrogenase (short-subunit alcohol dehydrogenase family)
MNIVHSSAGSLVGNRIQNQRVLVIGSGRGIGIAISARFAAENARVQLVARSESELDEARYSFGVHGAGVRATTLDLTSPAAIHQVIAEAE